MVMEGRNRRFEEPARTDSHPLSPFLVFAFLVFFNGLHVEDICPRVLNGHLLSRMQKLEVSAPSYSELMTNYGIYERDAVKDR